MAAGIFSWPTGPRGALRAAAVLLVAGTVFALHLLWYLPYIADDALISLRYAQRLLAGCGLTWSDGQRVEGYSDLLWVLACAGLGGLGLDLIRAARCLGILGGALAIFAVTFGCGAQRTGGLLPALVAGLSLALGGPLAIWAVGGLEHALVAGSLAGALVLCLPCADQGQDGAGPRRMLAAGVLLGSLVLLRVDGALLAAAVALGVMLCVRPSRATAGALALLALPPLGLLLTQTAFRLLYYDAWIPNTALVKVAFTSTHLRHGLAYLGAWALSHLGLLVLGLAACLAALHDANRLFRRRLLLLAPVALAWLAYVAVVGGDFLPGHRFMLPLSVVLALLSAQLLWQMRTWGRSWLARGHLLAWPMLGFFALCQVNDPYNTEAHGLRWAWDGQVVGRLLARSFGHLRPLLAVDAAGAIPYFSHLPALDMLGLNDSRIAHSRGPSFGRGLVGHELGDGEYILRRAPDLVVFGGAAGGPPRFLGGDQLRADPRFREAFTMVRFRGIDPHPFESGIWVRRRGRVGIQRWPGQVEVPGLLLNAFSWTVAHLDTQGRMGVTATSTQPAGLKNLHLTGGTWRVRPVFSGAIPRIRLLQQGSYRKLLDAAGGGQIHLAAETGISAEIRPAAGSRLHLRCLRFLRLAP